jgi:hypothetical protein
VASHDYAQISTVLHRLEQLSQLVFNPVHLAEVITGVISATADPPPGKPKELMQLAAAYRKAAMDTIPMVTDISSLSTDKLPEVWKGDVAVTATEVISSTSDLVGAIDPAFVNAAVAIEAYAGTLEGLQKKHGDLYQRLHDAMHSIGHVDIGGIDLPFPDLVDLAKWCAAVYSLITGCVGVYNDCLNAADELVGQLADVRTQARTAAPVRKGMPAYEAVVLADLGFDGAKGTFGYAVLSQAQLAGLPDLLSKLSPADRATLGAALAKAGSPLEEAYLLKALAAGHNVAEINGFAGLIRDKPDYWLTSHLALFDPGAPDTDADGHVVYTDASGTTTPIHQMDSTSCGATAIVVARAMNDPLYTLGLTTDGKGNDLTSTDFAKRLAAEEAAAHNATNGMWPQAAGTTPFGETAGMNAQSGTFGANYTTRMVDDTDPRSAGPALRDAITAVDAGHPVPVMLTPTPSQIAHGGEFHWVTLISHQNGQLTFYNPGGSIITIPESDFLNGQMQSLDHGATHVNAISVPG